jgi:hypothetical protein
MSTTSDACADRHDGEDVLATKTLAEHEGVLSADRDDERQPQPQAGHGREQSRHGSQDEPGRC